MLDKMDEIGYNIIVMGQCAPGRSLIGVDMNGNGTLTAQLRVGVPIDLKRRLKQLARQQRRSLSSTVRVLLEEAIELEADLTPSDSRKSEYEITLTVSQAVRLMRKGYDLQIWEPEYSQIPLL